MSQPLNTRKAISLGSGLILLASFFLPWVKWKDTAISGYQLPSGSFFEIAGSQFGLSNPFPQLNFTFYLFWLIPVLILSSIILTINNKRSGWPTMIAGALTLALLTVFFLFSNTLADLGVPYSISLFFWLALVSSLLFILGSFPPYNWLKKLAWIIIGPLFAYAGFLFVERTVWNQTHAETADLKADYIMSADALLQEFATNDSLANSRYREKIIEVKGKASAIEQSKDSTVNIRFADSTGSYIIFPFEKRYFDKLKNIKAGDEITLKGSCSGSIRSQILGTTSISFKRSTPNTK